MIDAFASWSHLVDHLAPIWCALPSEVRGRFFVADKHLIPHAAKHGIDAVWDTPFRKGGPVLVANRADTNFCELTRPLVYVEHGAGQTYKDVIGHPSYSGGKMRSRVALFLTLNETTAARERAAYPDARVEVIGSPRLDALAARQNARGILLPRSDGLTVAFAFHWDLKLVPETRCSFPHWREAIRDLEGWAVLGHAHPRIYQTLAPLYDRIGVEAVPDFAEVVERADVLAVDNSSVLYEAAALGVPVVALNAPWYRRDVSHGLRFWDLIPGPQCDEPADLPAKLEQAIAEGPGSVDEVYPPETRGRAASLAVGAILGMLSESPIMA